LVNGDIDMDGLLTVSSYIFTLKKERESIIEINL
jgi:hypothetical protein